MMRTVLLMDMSSVGNTSGVDRYIESLLKGMGKQNRYRLIWLSLRIDPDLIFHSEEHTDTHLKITIPLPEQASPILGKEYWAEQYYQAVTDIVGRYTDLSQVDLVHLHTLNLMDWGEILRRRYGCKVVTHLHCIPWKAYYNSNRTLFNQLYQRYYLDKNYEMKQYLTNMSEERSYCEGDHLVCVTECARQFVERITQGRIPHTSVIPNGMEDDGNPLAPRTVVGKESPITLLFVGVLSQSKGVYTLLNVTRTLQKRGYNVTLKLAGKGDDMTRGKIETDYSDLSVQLLGRIGYEELVEHYRTATVGCIASLQEQASYVAIEMCRYGLPIVTTAVDGLDEMFEEGISALKVSVSFDSEDGLKTDEKGMADAIERIVNEPELQRHLSKGARKRFEAEFDLAKMVERTLAVYDEVVDRD